MEEQEYWENGHPKAPKHIVCAANKFGAVLLIGARHWNQNMHAQADVHGGIKELRKLGKEEQGFIDQFGDYHNRVDALRIVKNNGQPFDEKRNGGNGTELFSEGLY